VLLNSPAGNSGVRWLFEGRRMLIANWMGWQAMTPVGSPIYCPVRICETAKNVPSHRSFARLLDGSAMFPARRSPVVTVKSSAPPKQLYMNGASADTFGEDQHAPATVRKTPMGRSTSVCVRAEIARIP